MTIAFPRTDIMSLADFVEQPFPLVSRQELSRTALGRTIAKDFGSALWLPTYTTVPLPRDRALAFEAALNSLDGAMQPFEAGDQRRLTPRLHSAASFGVAAGNGVLASVNANNKALAIAGLYAGQTVSVGDYLSFDYGTSRALHQVMEAATANLSGVTPQFEVRPHIRPGWSLSVVKLFNPRGLFTLVPGSVNSAPSGPFHNVVSFQAVQVL